MTIFNTTSAGRQTTSQYTTEHACNMTFQQVRSTSWSGSRRRDPRDQPGGIERGSPRVSRWLGWPGGVLRVNEGCRFSFLGGGACRRPLVRAPHTSPRSHQHLQENVRLHGRPGRGWGSGGRSRRPVLSMSHRLPAWHLPGAAGGIGERENRVRVKQGHEDNSELCNMGRRNGRGTTHCVLRGGN